MFNYLVPLIVFVIPIVCGPIGDGNETMSFAPSEEFSHECKEVVNTDIDLDKHKRINQAHENCLYDVVNLNHLVGDVDGITSNFRSAIRSNSSLSDRQNLRITNTIQKYCPNTTKIFDCLDILTPLYNECESVEESKFRSLTLEMLRRTFNFFCENNAELFIKFINEKFIDCVIFKDTELKKCYNELENIGDPKPLTKNEKAACSSIQNFKNCYFPKVEECSIETLQPIIKSFIKYVEPDTCTENANETSLNTSLP